MAESERLELSVDFGTQRAVENLRLLNQVLLENATNTDTFAKVVDKADARLNDLEKAAMDAGKKVHDLAKAEWDAKENLHAFDEKMRQSRLDDFGTKMGKLKGETAGTATGLEGVGRALGGMVAGVATVQTFLTLFENINREIRSMIQASVDVANKQKDRDVNIQGVAQAGGWTGEAGIQKAKALVDSLSKATASSGPQAQATVMSALARKFDPSSALVSDVNKFAARLNLSPSATDKVFDLMATLGINDSAGAQTLLSKLEASLGASGLTDKSAALNALVPEVKQNVLIRGGNLDTALGTFSAAALASGSAEGAAASVQATRRLGEPPDPKARARIAAEAARRGVIGVRGVSGAELDAELAGGTREDAEKFRDNAKHITATEQSIIRSDEDFAKRERESLQRIKELRKKRDARSIEDAGQAESDLVIDRKRHAEDQGKRRTEIAEMQAKGGALRAGVGEDMLGDRAVAAFSAMGLDASNDFVMSMFIEAQGNPAMQAKLKELMKSKPGVFDAAMIMASRMKDRQAAIGGVRGATGASQGTAFKRWQTTQIAAENVSEAENRASAAGAATIEGREYARIAQDANQAVQEATTRGEYVTQSRFYDPALGKLGFNRQEMNEAQQMQNIFWAEVSQLEGAISGDPALARAFGSEIARLRRDGQRILSHGSVNGAELKLHLRGFIGDLARLKAAVAAFRANSGGGVPLPPGSTPTGQTIEAGPRSDAGFGGGGGNIYVTMPVANQFVGASVEADLRGRLEGFG